MMYKEVLSFSEFEKRFSDYRRGRIAADVFLREFVIQGFDMDYASSAAVLFDDSLKGKVVDFLMSSPSTEEQWQELYFARRKKAAVRIMQADYPIGGFGDNWVLDFDPKWQSLARFQVYSLRKAFGLQIHEPDWDSLVRIHETLFERANLHSWVFQSRTRWFAFLNSHSTPYSMFNESPSVEYLREDHRSATVPQLIARLQLVELMHPTYFFNFRSRTLDQLRNNWGLSVYGIIRDSGIRE